MYPTGPSREMGVLLAKKPDATAKLPIKIISPEASPPTTLAKGVWDITLTSRVGDRAEDIINAPNEFSTGLKIRLDDGHTLDFVASPELMGSGYIVYGGTYTVIHSDLDGDELIVPLMKISEGDDIELPTSGVRMILRKTSDTLLVMDVPPPKKVVPVQSSSDTKSSRAKKKNGNKNNMS